MIDMDSLAAKHIIIIIIIVVVVVVVIVVILSFWIRCEPH